MRLQNRCAYLIPIVFTSPRRIIWYPHTYNLELPNTAMPWHYCSLATQSPYFQRFAAAGINTASHSSRRPRETRGKNSPPLQT